MIRSDNRWCNLRSSTQQLNQWNRKRKVDNTSGFKNVFYRKDRGWWYIRISTASGLKYQGSFKTPEEAHTIACLLRKQYQGDHYNNYI